MEKVNFNQEWYGTQAKVLFRDDIRIVIDYGCNGRGIVKNYNLFDGIQLCFLDFETDEVMKTQKFNPDIIQITHCQAGRYECEFANHTVSYLPEGYFSVAATEHLPVSFSFPLGICFQNYILPLRRSQSAISKLRLLNSCTTWIS